MGAFGALCLYSELAVGLGESQHAEALYAWIEPHRALNAVSPGGNYFLGSGSHFTGILLSALDRDDEALVHLRGAADMNAALGAPAHLVRTLMAIQPDVSLPAPPTDAGNWSDPAHTLRLRGERVRRLLGVDVADGEIAGLLQRLDFGVEDAGAGTLSVAVPSKRASKDVGIEET